jgi:hypothetical protein
MGRGDRASGDAADQCDVVEEIAVGRLDALERGENAMGKSRGAQPAASTMEFSCIKSVGAPMLGGVDADSGSFVAGLNTEVAQPARPPTTAETSIAAAAARRISLRCIVPGMRAKRAWIHFTILSPR